MRVATYARRIPPLQASDGRGWRGPGPRTRCRQGAGGKPATRPRRWSRSDGQGRSSHAIQIRLCAIVRPTVRRRTTEAHALISNAKHEQADQARPNRWQPRLISRYAGTRKPIRRRATCLTIQGSALAWLSCAWPARVWRRPWRRLLRGALLARRLLRRRPSGGAVFFAEAFFTAPLRVAFLATTLRADFFAGFLAADFFAVFLVAAFGMYHVPLNHLLLAQNVRHADARAKVHSF